MGLRAPAPGLIGERRGRDVGLPRQQITDPVERQDRRALSAELREIGREFDDPTPDAPTLSSQELDVLAQVALGKHNANVARQLGDTKNTVNSHLSSATH